MPMGESWIKFIYSFKSRWIDQIHCIIRNIPLQVGITRGIANRILADETPNRWVIPAGSIVVEFCIRVPLPAGVGVAGFEAGVAVVCDLAEGVVLQVLDDCRGYGRSVEFDPVADCALIVRQGPQDVVDGVLVGEELVVPWPCR